MIQITFSACCLGAASSFLLFRSSFSNFQICALSDDLIIIGFSINMSEIKKLNLHLRTSYPPFPKFPVYSFGISSKRVNREKQRQTKPKRCGSQRENKKEKEARRGRQASSEKPWSGQTEGRGGRKEEIETKASAARRKKESQTRRTGSRTDKQTQSGEPEPRGADRKDGEQAPRKGRQNKQEQSQTGQKTGLIQNISIA